MWHWTAGSSKRTEARSFMSEVRVFCDQTEAYSSVQILSVATDSLVVKIFFKDLHNWSMYFGLSPLADVYQDLYTI